MTNSNTNAPSKYAGEFVSGLAQGNFYFFIITIFFLADGSASHSELIEKFR